MSKVSLNYPVIGLPDSTEEPKVTTALKALEEFLNGAKIESTDNIKPEGITEASLSSAVKTKLAGTIFGLTYKQISASTEIKNGELFEAVSGVGTITLPTPTAGRTVGMFVGAAGPVKVTAAGAAKIFTDSPAAEGVTTVELTLYQHLVLTANGTNWLVMSGTIRPTQAYSAQAAITSAKEEEPSATRATDVHLEIACTGASSGTITVGGVVINAFNATTAVVPYSFRVYPGVKWKWTQVSGSVAVKASYLSV